MVSRLVVYGIASGMGVIALIGVVAVIAPSRSTGHTLRRRLEAGAGKAEIAASVSTTRAPTTTRTSRAAAGRTTTTPPKGGTILLNRASGRRLFALQKKEHEEGIGAMADGPVRDDQKWKLEPWTAGERTGAYLITNVASGRRLFAKFGLGGEEGIGAVKEGEVYEDQAWRIERQEDGSYLITNVASERRLYAQADRSGREGVGALDKSESYDDQRWYLVEPCTM